MKLLVAIKRVVDYNVKIRVKGDGSDVELANVKMGINPFCEIAVEEGVRLREAGVASELVVVTFGPDAASMSSRYRFLTALTLPPSNCAMGWRWGRIGRCIMSPMRRSPR